MKVLVTGIAGFIGSHIAQALLRNGHTIRGIDNLEGGDVSNVPFAPGARRGPTFNRIDCRDSNQIESLFERCKPDAVIHAAAYAAENYSHWCRAFLYQNNVVGTANVVNACVNHGVKHLVFLSSIAVYGKGKMDTTGGRYPDLNFLKFQEHEPPAPIDPYGNAKFLSELDIQCAGDLFGLNWTIFRPHNVIGARQNAADRTRNFVAIAIRHALEGKPIPIYGTGEQTRQFTPVSYVADCIAACVARPDTYGQVYNVGINEGGSIKNMAIYVSRACGVEPQFEFLPQRHEVVHAACDHSKLRLAFPDIAVPNLHDCLAEMVEETRNKPFAPYQEPPKPEISKLLPEWSKPK